MPEQVTIVMLDDSDTAIKLAESVLKEAGYRFLAFTSPVAMFQAAFRESPELVLLDVNMPLVDGPTVLNRIRSAKSLQNTIVVLYSDLPHAQLRQVAEQCKADGFIRKSSNTKLFLFQLKRHLEQKRA